MAQQTIKVGSRVQVDINGNGQDIRKGTVISLTERKARITYDGDKEGQEPDSVFLKYVQAIGGTVKVPKTDKPKAVSSVSDTGERVIPQTRKDGEPSKSITAGADVSHYVKDKEHLTAGGRPSFHIPDDVSLILTGLSPEEMCKVTARKLKELTGENVTATSLIEKYLSEDRQVTYKDAAGHKRTKTVGPMNPGQVRMNCANRLRAAIKNSSAEERA